MEYTFFFSIKNTENVVVFGIKHHCDIKIKACTSELAPPTVYVVQRLWGFFFLIMGMLFYFI